MIRRVLVGMAVSAAFVVSVAPAAGGAPPATAALEFGSGGADVSAIQTALNAQGHSLAVDGRFGPRTRAAVVAYQSANGLYPDGVVGPKTWAKLIGGGGSSGGGTSSGGSAASGELRLGSQGSGVQTVQQALADRGYDPGPVDGQFGSRTRAAVVAYQSANGLAADGRVGPRTWASLIGGEAPAAPAPAPSSPAPTPAASEPSDSGGWPDIEGTPSDATWDAIAQCESNGNWSINTGNGYYGGVQFALSSWQWVGGSGLPSNASKDEQIYRADLLWQRQGWNGWPACSRRLGLR